MTGMFHTNKNLHPDLIQQLTQGLSDGKAQADICVHYLRAVPEWFDAIAEKAEVYQVRGEGRDFHEGDILTLVRYDPDTQDYTRDQAGLPVKQMRRITYILEGSKFGLKAGHILLGLGPMEASP